MKITKKTNLSEKFEPIMDELVCKIKKITNHDVKHFFFMNEMNFAYRYGSFNVNVLIRDMNTTKMLKLSTLLENFSKKHKFTSEITFDKDVSTREFMKVTFRVKNNDHKTKLIRNTYRVKKIYRICK